MDFINVYIALNWHVYEGFYTRFYRKVYLFLIFNPIQPRHLFTITSQLYSRFMLYIGHYYLIISPTVFFFNSNPDYFETEAWKEFN